MQRRILVQAYLLGGEHLALLRLTPGSLARCKALWPVTSKREPFGHQLLAAAVLPGAHHNFADGELSIADRGSLSMDCSQLAHAFPPDAVRVGIGLTIGTLLPEHGPASSACRVVHTCIDRGVSQFTGQNVRSERTNKLI